VHSLFGEEKEEWTLGVHNLVGVGDKPFDSGIFHDTLYRSFE
jgi:hypothetical protein